MVTAFAVAVALAARTTPARADGISGGSTAVATYRLTSAGGLPAADSSSSAPQVVASVTPVDSVVPPTGSDGSQLSPLTILNTSSGFDPSQVIVALKDTVSNAGSPEQLFGLSFGAGGLKPGGEVDFTLSVAKSLTTPPVLQSLTPGITISTLGSTNSTTTSTSTPSSAPQTSTNSGSTLSIPEPMSVVLWSALAGAGLLRARAIKSRRRAS
jgi:hypothetical protein